MDFRKARDTMVDSAKRSEGVRRRENGPSRFDEIGSRLNARPIKSESLPHRTVGRENSNKRRRRRRRGGIVGIRKKDDSRPSNDPSAFCPFAFSSSALLSLSLSFSLFLSFLPPLPYQKNWSDASCDVYVCYVPIACGGGGVRFVSVSRAFPVRWSLNL